MYPNAEILNPVKGSIIKCIIKNKNAMGLLAQGFYENDNILEVIIPKISAGIISEINLDNLNINDEIYVEVFGKKFNIFDKSISIIGLEQLTLLIKILKQNTMLF